MAQTHPNLHFQISSVADFTSGDIVPTRFNLDFPNNAQTNGLLGAVPHQLTLLNLTPNIYGPGAILTLNLRVAGSANNNDTIDSSVDIPIPPGMYNYLTLPAIVEAAIDASPYANASSLTISNTTLHSSFSATTTIPGFDLYISSLHNVEAFRDSVQANISLNLWLGMDLNTDFLITPVQASLANIVNLAGPSQVNVCSRKIAAENSVGDRGIAADYLASVNLTTTPFGTWARTDTRDAKTIMVHFNNDRKLEKIDFKLCDVWGNDIPLPPQAIFNLDLVTHKFSH